MAADDRAGTSSPDRPVRSNSETTPDGASDGDSVTSPRVAPVRDDPDVAPAGGDMPSLGEVALAHRASTIATLDLADRPAAFEDLDAAIVAELRAIEEL